MARNRKKRFSLIWWVNSEYRDAIELTNFPQKQRKINHIATLVWQNHKTGEKSKSQAKILAISGKYLYI